MVGPVASRLHEANSRAEEALSACRAVIRNVVERHPGRPPAREPQVAEKLAAAESALRLAQAALGPYPALAHAGFLHDAAKEYVEARATVALVEGDAVPGPERARRRGRGLADRRGRGGQRAAPPCPRPPSRR